MLNDCPNVNQDELTFLMRKLEEAAGEILNMRERQRVRICFIALMLLPVTETIPKFMAHLRQ